MMSRLFSQLKPSPGGMGAGVRHAEEPSTSERVGVFPSCTPDARLLS